MDISTLTKALLQNSLGNYKTAFQLITQSEQSYHAQLATSIIFINLGQYQDAINILEKIDQNQNPLQTQFLLGKAYFLNGQNENAMIQMQKVKDSLQSNMDEQEIQDIKEQVDLLVRKIQLEMSQKSSLGNINDAAYMPTTTTTKQVQQTIQAPKQQGPVIDPKYDWYQNATHVFISFKVNSPEVAQDTQVYFENDKVILDYPKESTKIEMLLANQIIPESSSKSTSAKKIEIKLKKTQDNINWMSLEKGQQPKLMATTIPTSNDIKPSYPTSSKKAKNWDQIDKEINKEMAQEKPEGDAALNSLFKQIYERADENTRRAMIKSYQTSGGTVLSTNWDEVARKDYEGKDRPEAPEGQKWAKDE